MRNHRRLQVPRRLGRSDTDERSPRVGLLGARRNHVRELLPRHARVPLPGGAPMIEKGPAVTAELERQKLLPACTCPGYGRDLETQCASCIERYMRILEAYAKDGGFEPTEFVSYRRFRGTGARDARS